MASETQVREGSATLHFPSKKGVFYNPPQIPNRDLSVLALRQFTADWKEEAAERAALRAARSAAAAEKRTAFGASAVDGPKPVDSSAGAGDNSSVAPAPGDEASGTAPAVKLDAAEAEVPSPKATEEAAAADADADAKMRKAPADAPGGSRIRVLDALSASGLRAMRYALEVPGLDQIVANDVDPAAVEVMRRNFERNGLGEPLVVSNVADAARLLHESRPPNGERFEVVDLDPYGSAAPFLDSAVQAVAEGGMLMATCTDLAVLCGTYPEACYAKYGAFSLKGKHCHEAALRILLGAIDTHANRYGRYIKPLLAVHINFYVRVFVRIYSSKSTVKLSPTKKAYLYQCSGCHAYALQQVARHIEKGNSSKIVAGTGPPVPESCAHCGKVHHVGGPLWSAPMQDDAFVRRLVARMDRGEVFDSQRRLSGLLASVLEELPDVPLFTQLAAACATLHIGCPPLVAFISALMRQGYRVSRSHTDPMAIKTDAPFGAFFDVLRCWARDNEQKRGKGGEVDLSYTAPGHTILSKQPETEADFRPLPQVQQLLSKRGADGGKVSKFLPTPAEWGPGSRATTHATLGGASTSDTPSAAAADGGETEPTHLDASQLGTSQYQKDKRATNQGKRARKRRAQEMDAEAEGRAPPVGRDRVANAEGCKTAAASAAETGETQPASDAPGGAPTDDQNTREEPNTAG